MKLIDSTGEYPIESREFLQVVTPDGYKLPAHCDLSSSPKGLTDARTYLTIMTLVLNENDFSSLKGLLPEDILKAGSKAMAAYAEEHNLAQKLEEKGFRFTIREETESDILKQFNYLQELSDLENSETPREKVILVQNDGSCKNYNLVAEFYEEYKTEWK